MLKRALSPLILLVIASLMGCNSGGAASNANAKQNPAASANSNSTENANQATRSAEAAGDAGKSAPESKPGERKSPSPPALVGAYEAREVQDKGVVTLMSAVSTVIYFSPEGTYSRVSQKDGKVYHRDSGTFRIQPPDKLLLTIQTSDRKIQSPPLDRTHTFSLSADGEELRLTSDKGAIAVFRRGPAPKK